jgi:predicted RNA-binding Zn ribbon-like protein
VQLDHDSVASLSEVVELVNSDDRRSGIDCMTTPESLAEYVERRGVSGHRTGTDDELRAVRRLRARLRAIFDAAAQGQRDQVVEEINRLIADSRAVPRLVEHDGKPIHLHYNPSDAPLHHFLGAEMGLALAVVLSNDGLDRLRVCESPDCGRVLVDLSRNHSRRYCDTQCGNRQHVASYRARQAGAT